mgnify:CR=1 FL=1
MKRVYKCEYCYLQNARPCYECSACMSGDDHFRPAKPEKKQMTNADKIRAMSDEELAAWMSECNAYREYAIASQWLPWLKQSAEEGER